MSDLPDCQGAGFKPSSMSTGNPVARMAVDYAGEKPDFVVLKVDKPTEELVQMIAKAKEETGIHFLALGPGVTLERALTRGNLRRMLADLEGKK